MQKVATVLPGLMVLRELSITPFFHQLDNTVGHQFGMDSQMFFIGKMGQHGVGNPSVADLERIAILDQPETYFPMFWAISVSASGPYSRMSSS